MSDATDRNSPNLDEYTALRAEFAEWLLDPHKRGTQQQWAVAHNVSEFTVSRWRSHPEVTARVSKWRDELNPDLGRVMANMVRLALGSDGSAVQAARLLADVFGQTKQEIDLNLSAPFIKLQEQLVSIRTAALKAERDQLRTN